MMFHPRSSRPSRASATRALRSCSLLLLVLLLAACGRNMSEQPSLRAYEGSNLFADGAGFRPIPEGTVSREVGAIDESFFTGQDAGGLLAELPVALDLELLQRGRERYDIFCAACHNYDGSGQGIIVQRGFPQPTSFHDPRLRQQPVGYFFSAMTNGFGRMYSYASRVPAEDRWAIAGYIRALQLSQFAGPDDLPQGLSVEELAAGGQR
jgi:cytochrome c553